MSHKLYVIVLLILVVNATIPFVRNKILNEGSDALSVPDAEKTPGWRIQLQPGWKRIEKHTRKNTQIFSSPDRSKGVILVKTERWIGSDALYGSQNLDAIRSNTDNQVLNSTPIMVSGHFGVVSLYSTSTFIIFEIAVAMKGVGYIVQCSGNFHSIDEASAICEQQLSTFRLLN